MLERQRGHPPSAEPSGSANDRVMTPHKKSAPLSPQAPRATASDVAEAAALLAASDPRKSRILDSAESLFAEQGFAHVSVRDIAVAAKANVAAVNYHFGSKEKLFEALFARRVVPVNQQRLELLTVAETRSRNGRLGLREVVDAFVRPPLLLGDPTHGEQGMAMMRFLSRMLAMPKEHVFLEAYYGEVRGRFIAALTSILPGLPYETVLWRYNLMVGALIYALAGPQRMLRPPASEPPQPSRYWDVEDAIAEVVDFCAAGFSTAGSVVYR